MIHLTEKRFPAIFHSRSSVACWLIEHYIAGPERDRKCSTTSMRTHLTAVLSRSRSMALAKWIAASGDESLSCLSRMRRSSSALLLVPWTPRFTFQLKRRLRKVRSWCLSTVSSLLLLVSFQLTPPWYTSSRQRWIDDRLFRINQGTTPQ